MAAALDCFLDDGIAGASIEDVCARSGASVGSVYHHFGGKQGLASAVYLAALADYQAGFLAELDAHFDDAEAAVRAIVHTHLRWYLVEQPAYGRFLLVHGDAARGAGCEQLTTLSRTFFAGVLAWWRRHAERGALRRLDLDLVYALWLGPAQEYCRLHHLGRVSVVGVRAAPALADGAWQSLRSRPAARSAN